MQPFRTAVWPCCKKVHRSYALQFVVAQFIARSSLPPRITKRIGFPLWERLPSLDAYRGKDAPLTEVHAAPLGLGRRGLSPGYRHVAPLGLNQPAHVKNECNRSPASGLGNPAYRRTIVDFSINETRQTGAVRKTKLPFYRLVGAVSNCAYSVRLKTAPTGGRKCLFVFNSHHNSEIHYR